MADRHELSIEIKGIREISDALKGLPRDLAQKVLNQATRKQVVNWQKQAVALAPISKSERTITVRHVVSKRGKLFTTTRHIRVPGNLRRSIKVKKMKPTGNSFTEQEARYGIKILGRAFYWKWVEFGSIHNPPLGFLRATFAALSETSLLSVAGDCRKGIANYFRQVKKLTPPK